MNLDGITGPNFWHNELPKEIDRLLAGVPQELDLPEDFEVQAPIECRVVRGVLGVMIEDYRADLQGVEVYGTKEVEGRLQGVARKFDIESFKSGLSHMKTVEDVARVLVKIASFYAPDYGKVGHPCHQWCKDWGRCPDIQKAAITSLIQHFCSAYARQVI